MGFVFTLVFVFVAYYSPQAVLGDYAQYHIEFAIAAITLIACLISAPGSGAFKFPQTYALCGLVLTVALSLLFVWPGAIPSNLMDFMPSAMIFFFILWSCKTKRQLQVLVLVLLSAALFTIYKGYSAQLNLDYKSLYVLMMRNDDGDWFFRIRGLTFQNDPNDLAQFFVAMLPLSFLLWKKGSPVRNVLFVYLPSAGLIFGMFLTHSRGGMVALMVVAVMVGRKKIGVLPSLIGGLVVFGGLMASGFSGGRDVGANAGEDRMAAWSAGLGLIKGHPLFGVGFKRFTDFYEITAHNTIVVTAAELGLIGLFFWLLFTLPSVRDMIQIASASAPEAKEEADEEHPLLLSPRWKKPLRSSPTFAFTNRLATAYGSGLPLQAPSGHASAPATLHRSPVIRHQSHFSGFDVGDRRDPGKTQADVRRMANVVLASFSGFLAASWFLSRPYTMTLFLIAGISAVVVRIAQTEGLEVQPLALSRAAKLSAIATILLVAVVYVVLRISHLFPK